jgi:arylsulfatase A-like enzyme
LERLAREGVVFDHASSPVPLTLPAHTSLFTGLLPPHHGVRDNADKPLADSIPTLASTLLASGFRTGAFVGSVVLDPDRGLRRGFEMYRGVEPGVAMPETAEGRQRRGDAVVDDAIRWIDQIGDARFLLWTHLYDAHRPYNPPEPFYTQYRHDLYLGELAFVDAQIGRLIGALERRHLLDRTVIVVTADHGESLGEHGERDHGVFVYESVLHVPLIVRAPNLAASRVGGVVRLTDVMPTVLDALKIQSPQVDGVSLLPVAMGRSADVDLAAYAESQYPERFGWSSLRAMREGRYKLIEAPRPELYDLDDDPYERINLYDARPVLVSTLTAKASAVLASTRPAASTQPGAASPDLQARLSSLGYVAGPVPIPVGEQSKRPDPKDCIGLAHESPIKMRLDPVCGSVTPIRR